MPRPRTDGSAVWCCSLGCSTLGLLLVLVSAADPPQSKPRTPQSYTVSLVAPAALGPALSPPPAPKPQPPKVEVKGPKVEPKKPKVEAKKPKAQPPKVEARKPKRKPAVAKPKEPVKIAAKKEPPPKKAPAKKPPAQRPEHAKKTAAQKARGARRERRGPRAADRGGPGQGSGSGCRPMPLQAARRLGAAEAVIRYGGSPLFYTRNR